MAGSSPIGDPDDAITHHFLAFLAIPSNTDRSLQFLADLSVLAGSVRHNTGPGSAVSTEARDMTLSYRWVIVAIGALMTCVALGAAGVALAFPPLPIRARDELQPA
jgi:hypothetical protein